MVAFSVASYLSEQQAAGLKRNAAARRLILITFTVRNKRPLPDITLPFIRLNEELVQYSSPEPGFGSLFLPHIATVTTNQ